MTQDSQDTARRGVAPRGGLGGLLRAIAGGLVGWRRMRRGSFLVMVVGTLALLAVFTILYVSIGNQDVRSRAAQARREALDDVPRAFREYVANDIIAADVLATWLDAGSAEAVASDLSVGLRVRRETTDYPIIDWDRRSDVPTDGTSANFDASLVFSPVGTFDPGEITVVSQVPFRAQPTDPWLASPEPVYLNFTLESVPANEPPYLRRRDWGQVSNVAPDGRFVNLNRLRNNFRATHLQMAQGLTLYASGVTGTNTFFGTAPNVDVPAHWSSMQVGAYRAVTDDLGLPVASDSYPGYQWVDTDGDGFYDARWFELVDLADRSLANSEEIRLIEGDGSIRWFFATRIVDLSGLLNVNYAGDFRAGPSVSAAVGSGGPAEFDLRRVLMLRDAYDTNPSGAAPEGGYDGIIDAAVPNDYTGNYSAVVASSVGRFGYEALRMSLAAGFPMPKFTPAGQIMAGANLDPAFNANFGVGTGPAVQPAEYQFFSATPTGTPLEVRRRQYWERASELFRGIRSTYMEAGGPAQFRAAGVFNLDDQAELLTYWGSNDDAVTSTLEAAVGGRDNTGGNNPSRVYFSPLRDNRSGTLERIAGTRSLTAVQLREEMLRANSDVRRLLTTVSGARQLRSRVDFDGGTLTARDLKLDASELLEGGQAAGLFGGYVEALAPFTHLKAAWDTGAGAAYTRYRTLFYGHRGPELALHVAAHAALNMKDLYDYDGGFGAGTNPFTTPDTNPKASVYTLVLDDTFIDRTNFQDPEIDSGRNPEYFPAFSPNAAPPLIPRRDYFYLNRGLNPSNPNADNHLGNAASQLTAPLVNVYGIEPQPFITNVSTFTVYTDVPNSAGNPGDDEPGDGSPNATIDGDLTQSNQDLLYRALAVQITNPFDQDVDISTGTPGNVTAEYYLRVRQAGAPPGTPEAFGLFGREPGNFSVISPIRIPARSSVVVMIVSEGVAAIRDRIANADPTASALSDATAFRQIIANAMDDTARRVDEVYWVPAFDPLAGTATYPGPGSFSQVVFTDTPVVEMWRIRAEDRRVTGTTIGDQLIDRMRMPASAGLDRSLPPGSNDISGSNPDDDGWTITLWASVRRPADPSASKPFVSGQFKEPLGSIPAFCMEPKYSVPDPTLTKWNVSDDDQVNVATLSGGDFDGAGRRRGNHRTVEDWRVAMSDDPPVIPHLGIYPGSVGSADMNGGTLVDVDTVGTPAGSPGDVNPLPDIFPAGQNYSNVYPLNTSDNRRFRRPTDPASAGSALVKGLRHADLLLPMGIGPVNVPMDGTGTLYDDFNDPMALRRWTTLAEALAVAMGYENYPAVPGYAADGMPSGTGGSDVMSLYAPVTVGSATVYPLDRGQLWLDAFTPFLDMNGNRVFNATGSTPDRRAGLEVPLALGVLDVFDVPGPGARTLTKMVPGLVNINTAPLPVLRAAPMLSPITGTNPENGTPAWWWGSAALNTEADLAVSLAAYRDGVAMPFRPMSRVAPNPVSMKFLPADSSGGMVPHGALSFYDGSTANMARSAASLVDSVSGAGVNEWPGFKTLGEAVLARVHSSADPASPGWKSNAGFMGRNGNNNSTGSTSPNDDRVGVNSLVFQPDPANTSTMSPDDIRDDYAEQLAAIQGVLGGGTVRSDVFAVWFVVAGFRENDVAVGNDDPIVPSIKRRFLMIVDRSNVVKKGDKPNILVFKELPVEN